jgi:hypothetical protein
MFLYTRRFYGFQDVDFAGSPARSTFIAFSVTHNSHRQVFYCNHVTIAALTFGAGYAFILALSQTHPKTPQLGSRVPVLF